MGDASRCETACGTLMQKWEPRFRFLDARWGSDGTRSVLTDNTWIA